MLGLVGEAGQNEAVVPLPDGRSIPVTVREPVQQKSPEVTVVNVLDPAEVVTRGLSSQPNLVYNPILMDFASGGPLFQTMIGRMAKRR
jgi:hypothetical protein